VSLGGENMRALRRLLDDVIHAAHVHGEPDRDWNVLACTAVGAESLADLTDEQALQLVGFLRAEQNCLRAAARENP
jgi:hypothetical protein